MLLVLQRYVARSLIGRASESGETRASRSKRTAFP